MSRARIYLGAAFVAPLLCLLLATQAVAANCYVKATNESGTAQMRLSTPVTGATHRFYAGWNADGGHEAGTLFLSVVTNDLPKGRCAIGMIDWGTEGRHYDNRWIINCRDNSEQALPIGYTDPWQPGFLGIGHRELLGMKRLVFCIGHRAGLNEDGKVQYLTDTCQWSDLMVENCQKSPSPNAHLNTAHTIGLKLAGGRAVFHSGGQPWDPKE